MPQWLVQFLAQYLLPGILNLFLAFFRNLTAARANDPQMLSVVVDIVRGVGFSHPEWSGEQKRSYAVAAAKSYFTSLGRDVGDSITNTLVELAVQQVKGEE